MKAESGAELACRARTYRFEYDSRQHEHGIISYYALQTLARATTMESWLQQIEIMSSADLHEDRLPWFFQPFLKILGPSTTRLPGNPIGVDAKEHR